MPTMKQVNEMIAALADEFDFSEQEARIFLKLPIEVTKPKKEAAEPNKPKAAKTSPSSTPRAPSTYNLFVKAESAKVKAALEKSSGGKLERGAVMKELGAKWKNMTDSQKAKYAA